MDKTPTESNLVTLNKLDGTTEANLQRCLQATSFGFGHMVIKEARLWYSKVLQILMKV